LDRAVVERIAAGEVVDGPDAVVRELVDNALDASARLVQVELRRGGLDLIRVADDGHGLEPDEIGLAFAHHTTSKLRSLDDLQRLETLGFRGEALPSIAAAAEVELVSSIGADGATRALVRGGRIVERGPAGRQPGTTIWVRGLFAGLPARLRFLRGARAEVAAVARRLRWYAVAHPDVRLELIADGHPVFKARGAGRRELALAEALGADLSAALVSVGPESVGDYQIEALLSARGVTRPSRQHLALFVNRRRVRVPAVDAALEAAYRGLLPSGRHPIGAIWIEAGPGAVDVNVHPAKEEIRLRDEAALAEAVASLLRGALAGSALEPEALQSVHLTDRAASRQLGESEPLWELPAGPGPPRYLAQLHGSLLLCEARNGLYLIDLHRAH
jgi:DNA mismatch repair protein MutL